MKASDISDEAIYSEVERQVKARGYSSAMLGELAQSMPQFPYKIVFAKVRQMIAKGRLRGCDCGCRGDLRFPWQEFGDKPDIQNWQDRVAAYLRTGKRNFGY